MKVKYKQPLGILSCSNADFEFDIYLKVTNNDGTECVLYDPICALKFVDNNFFNSCISLIDSEHDQWVKALIYQGCSVTIQNKVFVTMVGLKHIFSNFIGLRQKENRVILNREQSKFLNWFLKFDIDSYVLKTLPASNTCKVCQAVLKDEQPSFCENNSQLIDKWRNDSIRYGEAVRDSNERIDYIANIVDKAAKELKSLILQDCKVNKNKITSLANYDPEDDWESTCPIVKHFIDEILSENNSTLFKVVFRNNILVGNQKQFNHSKPQSCYFISSIVKYLHDKQKILDFLSKIGIGVTDDAMNNLEKKQISKFNSLFWDLPDNSTVMAVMDNNQTDFSTKTFKPLNDTHHVDCLNVLQVIKPPGNLNLNKTSKQIDNLEYSFIDSTEFEKEAGDFFVECFNTMLIRHIELQPLESLKEPAIQDIMPCGGDPSLLATEFTIRLFKEDGNILKQRLIDGPKYCPYNLNDPADAAISWNNKEGSKTSLRYLKMGKSTDDHVFLESLDFLYNTFKTDKREKIFMTLDQALHTKYKNLQSRGKLS